MISSSLEIRNGTGVFVIYENDNVKFARTFLNTSYKDLFSHLWDYISKLGLPKDEKITVVIPKSARFEKSVPDWGEIRFRYWNDKPKVEKPKYDPEEKYGIKNYWKKYA
jgi:hypothetical protein